MIKMLSVNTVAAVMIKLKYGLEIDKAVEYVEEFVNEVLG